MQRADALRTILAAALIGIPISLASILLLALNHELEHLVWVTLPDEIGAGTSGDPAWWFVIAVTTVAGALAAALLLRVRTDVSHGVPLEPVPLRHLPWLLAGAAATLAGGLVLGPEAPLLTLGVAMAATAARHVASGDPESPVSAALALAGATAVLGVVLGNPVIGIVLVLEIVVASGKVEPAKVTAALLPAMLAAGLGAITYTGFGNWTGIEPTTLVIPDLPAYDAVQLVDLALTIPVAVVAALVVVATKVGVARLRGLTWLRTVPGTAAIGLATGVLAVGYSTLTDRSAKDVLFSGQAALPDLISVEAAWILGLLILAKGIAYALALSGQLEGGQIFPALALAAAVGVAASIVVPDSSLSAMLAVAIAAGTTSLQRLPIFGIIFALLLVVGSNAADVTPLAVLAAVVGYLVATVADQRLMPAGHAAAH